jgi:hypothetical protein
VALASNVFAFGVRLQNHMDGLSIRFVNFRVRLPLPRSFFIFYTLSPPFAMQNMSSRLSPIAELVIGHPQLLQQKIYQHPHLG